MKRLLSLIAVLFLIFPIIGKAHTDLKSSNPQPGQVVTESLDQIDLTFAGSIESLSTMTLQRDGQEVPDLSVEVQQKQLIGTLAAPLENGSYLIQWSIAGEDGHLIEGEIPFTVEINEVTDESSEKSLEEKKNEDENTQETGPEQPEEPANESSNSPQPFAANILIPIVAILILGAGCIILFGRKKK
ncbi:copper resistance protein CopC [Bacillus infantis]|uniref:copper resistance CopC family protein n=1 Tax=Bacillus infantis TaxID=324767 RepID=UPI001CD51B35|nr:copper resistance protein CopC [Bacillus infantis]MCA1037528.1 copper resistance protein CopC [Bacillus infantis]HER2025546.1 copper resistance protein CopC [Streptococcus pyogenes]